MQPHLEIHVDPRAKSNRDELLRLVRASLRELDNAVVETGRRELLPAMIKVNQSLDQLLEAVVR